jgi:hypothetical protein
METVEYTERIFIHYFKLALTKAGVPWDTDFGAELSAALDPIRDLERRVADLEAATLG